MPKPKQDRYRRARGGRTRFLHIHCAACDNRVVLYQKDGAGGLHRLYLNRIFEPAELEELQRRYSKENEVPALRCPQCAALIGTPMRYSDGRLAFRLVPGSFKKRGAK